MKEKYVKFAEYYKDIALFGIDRVQNEMYRDKYLINFSEGEFYDELYVSVDLEKYSFDKVDAIVNGSLVTICGPSGSGKSTVSKKVINSLSANPRYKVLTVDARIENSLKGMDDNETCISDNYVRELILNEFEREFDLNIENYKKSKRLELYCFLLSPEAKIKKCRDLQVFRKTNSISKDVSLEYIKYKNSADQPLGFSDWFYDNFQYDNISKSLNKLEEEIDICHYIGFNRYKDEYDKLIIWVDNIDAFSNIQQSQIITILQNIQKSVLNSSQLVVSVREENVYRVGDYKDNHNAPFISRVSFTNPKGKKGFKSYESINVPVMTPIQLNELVSNKLKFAYKKHVHLDRKYMSKLGVHNNYIEDLKKNNIPLYNIKRESLIEAKKSLQKKLDSYRLFALKWQHFKYLKSLSTKIVTVFDQERVIFLANNSIKEYLRIHSAFLDYIISLDKYDKGLLQVEHITKSQIRTLFHSWIYTIDDIYGIEGFNVIEEVATNENAIEHERIGCFLPYLLLTKIWNKSMKLNGKPSPMNNPFVKDVINDIEKDFGFTKDEIISSLYHLYRNAGGKGNFITFRSKKKVEIPEDIDMDSTVRVTYRGKTTLGITINSFGYLKECSQRVHDEDVIVDEEELVFEKLKILCDIHLKSLIQLRDRNYAKIPNWYNKYVIRYGIPCDPCFTRSNVTGCSIPNVRFNRAIYVETIFDSFGRYFKKGGKSEKTLTFIANRFNKHLEDIKDFKEEISKINFDEI